MKWKLSTSNGFGGLWKKFFYSKIEKLNVLKALKLDSGNEIHLKNTKMPEEVKDLMVPEDAQIKRKVCLVRGPLMKNILVIV